MKDKIYDWIDLYYKEIGGNMDVESDKFEENNWYLNNFRWCFFYIIKR